MPHGSDRTAAVLDTIRGLVAETDPGRQRARIGLDDSLTRDLALGSLERVELLLRLERATGVRLPESLLAEADTPRQLVAALQSGRQPADAGRARSVPTVPADASGGDAGDREAAAERRRAISRSATTLVDALRLHAESTPNRVHIRLRTEDGGETAVTYASLWRDAGRVAGGLRSRGIAPGERVALLLRTEEAFFRAYFGILLAGGVPVPLYPPFRADQIEEYAARQSGILRNAGARLLLTFAQAERAAGLLRPLAPALTDVVTVDAVVESEPGPLPSVEASHLALIQYTSGSTGAPKGVALSHANLLANIRAFGEAFEVHDDDVVVTWLPLYHDMGLIGTWFGPLVHGVPVVVMSPLAFLSRPVRWLEAISAYRGTLSAAPNFAYDLCARKVADDELAGLDLRSWRCALNGAEAVIAATLDRFAERFGPYGFRRDALKPVYGLAEASLCVTAPPPGRGPRVDRIARDGFQRARAIEPASASDPHPLSFVACGRPIHGHEVRCVDAGGAPAAERVEGHVQFRGPSAMTGYFGDAKATAAVTREGGWIDTGDLGYLADGDLYVTGRVKDVIIAGGRNIYPQELEEGVADVAGVRRGCVAAFGAPDPRTGTERLVVVAETREREPAERTAIHDAIVARVLDVTGVPPDAVVLAPPGSIPKTSSGKIRRTATRDLHERGLLGRGRASAAIQWLRLARGDAAWRLGRAWRLAGTALFSAWAWLLAASLAPVLWIALAATRTPAGARRVTRAMARLLLALAGCRVRLEGGDPSSLPAPAVLVANHASYLDVVVLLAVLPPHVRFAAKARLATYPVLGLLIRRTGYVQVQRGTTAAAEAFAQTLREGESLVLFPEGTFMRAPGTLPFRLGAFQAAVDTRTPIVPLAITGTRDVWPDGTLLMRRGALTVTVGAPIDPEEGGWPEMVRLRDATRAWIAGRTGEAEVDRAPILLDAVPAPTDS